MSDLEPRSVCKIDGVRLALPSGSRECPRQSGSFVIPSETHLSMNEKKSDNPQFLLLMRQPYDGTGARPDPEQMQQIMTQFMNWLDGIRAHHEVLSTNGLEDRCQIVRGLRGEILSDGPYLEAKEIIGGYVLITADNYDQALAIARECPGLAWGMGVEVRPVIRR